MEHPEVLAAIVASLASLITSFVSLYISNKNRQSDKDSTLRNEIMEAFKIAREEAEPTENAIARLWSLFQEQKHLIDSYFNSNPSDREQIIRSIRNIYSEIALWHSDSGAVLDERLRGIWHGQKNMSGVLVDLAERHRGDDLPPLSDARQDFETQREALTKTQALLSEYNDVLRKRYTDRILKLVEGLSDS